MNKVSGFLLLLQLDTHEALNLKGRAFFWKADWKPGTEFPKCQDEKFQLCHLGDREPMKEFEEGQCYVIRKINRLTSSLIR